MANSIKLKCFGTALFTIWVSGTVAQNNYHPATSVSTDHSYFKGGIINIINSSHQDIAWHFH
jgi:hypothetical protein